MKTTTQRTLAQEAKRQYDADRHADKMFAQSEEHAKRQEESRRRTVELFGEDTPGYFFLV
jgi:hypothetical protein